MIVDRLRAAAREALPAEAWTYLEASAGDGRMESEAAWRRWRLRPRVLRGVAAPDPATRLFGEALDLPVLLSPAGRSTRWHPEGELAVAKAARAGGTIAVLPSSIAHDAAVPASAGRIWQQLYILTDPDAMQVRLAEAEAAGAGAIVITVDLLPGAAPDIAPAPAAAWETKPARPGAGLYCGATLDHLATICAGTQLPVLVKGVLRGDDAAQCVAAGAAGLVVSNHGGNQLVGAISSAAGLPDVVDAVRGRAVILVDGGIRGGSDILKALALGADAVLVGRPTAYALAAGGTEGVVSLLTGLKEEIVRAMALCGVAGLSALDTSFITSEAS